MIQSRKLFLTLRSRKVKFRDHGNGIRDLGTPKVHKVTLALTSFVFIESVLLPVRPVLK